MIRLQGRMTLSPGCPVWPNLAPIFRLAFSRDQSGQMAEGDYRDWNAIRAWAGELVPVLIGPQ